VVGLRYSVPAPSTAAIPTSPPSNGAPRCCRRPDRNGNGNLHFASVDASAMMPLSGSERRGRPAWGGARGEGGQSERRQEGRL